MAKIGGAATPMGNRISMPLPATSHAQRFGRWAGWGKAAQLVAVDGEIRQLVEVKLNVSLAGLFNDTRFLQISAPVQPGNSGGPLLDTRGSIVGVVAEKLNALKVAKATGEIPENINFAIKTGALRDFLDNSVVPYRTSELASEMKTAEIATAARAYTMLISCMARDIASEKKK